MRYLIWPVFLFISLQLFAQERTVFFVPTQVWIGVQPMIEQPLKITQLQSAIVQSKPRLGIGAELGMFFPVKGKWGLGCLGGVRIHSYNLTYHIPDTVASPVFRSLRINSTLCGSAHVGLLVRRWFYLASSTIFSIEGNAKVNYFPTNSEGIGFGLPDIAMLQLTMATRGVISQSSVTPSFALKAGLWVFPTGGNSIQGSIIAGWSPSSVGSGQYRLQANGENSRGVIRLRQNYLGLELAYGLSLRKKVKR